MAKLGIGDLVTADFGGSPLNSTTPIIVTAAGTGDNTAVTGKSVDRLGYESLTALIGCHAKMAATETLSIAAEYQESDDNSSWDTAVALQASTVALTGGSGGTTEFAVLKFDLDLRGKKRYIRINHTPNLSAGSADIAATMVIVVKGGADVLPAA